MPNYQMSRRSVLAAIAVLDERLSQADLTRFLLELGPDFPQLSGGERLAVSRRLNNIMSVFDQTRDHQIEDGRLLGDALVEKAVLLLQPKRSIAPWLEPVSRPSEAALLRALELEGFTISEGTLRRTLPAEADLPGAESEIMRLLDVHGFATAKGHLQQAIDAHSQGAWASANSQFRTFLEGLLDEIAAKLDPKARTLGSSQARRAHLANIDPPFLLRTLNEWDDNGLGFINGLVRRLHPAGSHPGLSDEADSTFRLHVVLVTTRLLLVRFNVRA